MSDKPDAPADRTDAGLTVAGAQTSVTSGTSQEQSLSPDAIRDKLVDIVGKRGFWWWRVLLYTRTYEAFIPWPLDWLITRTLGRLSRRAAEVEGSAWTTLSIFIGLFLWHHLGRLPVRDFQLAIEVARILLSASFLIGTILSLSVALPGQALIKLVLKDDPEYALEFVVPFMWAFMWGVLGATSLLCFYSSFVLLWMRPYAIFVASYAACMLLHALTHAMRKYLLGLLMKSRDDDKNS